MNEEKSKELREFIKFVLWAFLITLIVRTFIVEPYRIPSGSMMPNLVEGDFIIVSKFNYGISPYSIPLNNFKFFEGRIAQFSKPERGDIVVFRIPNNTSINYVKRLIGLPGDKIQIKSGVLYINDQEVKTIYALHTDSYNQYIETLPNSVSYKINHTNPDFHEDNSVVYTVPPNQYFFMGDNRDNSLDSRFNLGFVNEDFIVGKVQMILFSMPTVGWNIFNWLMQFNPNRLFLMVNRNPI